MTLEAICFDLDDTLYPYKGYARTGLKNAAEYLADSYGVDVEEELLELYFDDAVTNGTFDCLVDRYDDLPASLISDLVEEYHNATGALEPYESTEHVLNTLQDDGYQLGLITDGRNGYEKLRRLELEGFFDSIVVTTEFGATKHYRDPFYKVLDDLSVVPEQMVYVGDDPRVDFEIPNQLGMGTVRIRRGRYKDLNPAGSTAKPDIEIDSIGKLPRVLSVESEPLL